MTARIEVEEWQAPPARERAPRNRPVLLHHCVTLVLVLALHALVALQLVLPALRVGPPRAAASPVMVASLVGSESLVASASEPAPIPPLPPSFSVPAPDLLPISFTEDADVEAPESNDFSPPRLHEKAALEPTAFAVRAGIAISKSARVILTVMVTDEGTAGEIAVTISSGNSKLDSVAIEYVRALRWHPAVVQGRQSSMNIRLPVVFAVPG